MDKGAHRPRCDISQKRVFWYISLIISKTHIGHSVRDRVVQRKLRDWCSYMYILYNKSIEIKSYRLFTDSAITTESQLNKIHLQHATIAKIKNNKMVQFSVLLRLNYFFLVICY